jgi:hypothetical protein
VEREAAQPGAEERQVAELPVAQAILLAVREVAEALVAPRLAAAPRAAAAAEEPPAAEAPQFRAQAAA